jgi:hypothetical protein
MSDYFLDATTPFGYSLLPLARGPAVIKEIGINGGVREPGTQSTRHAWDEQELQRVWPQGLRQQPVPSQPLPHASAGDCPREPTSDASTSLDQRRCAHRTHEGRSTPRTGIHPRGLQRQSSSLLTLGSDRSQSDGDSCSPVQ